MTRASGSVVNTNSYSAFGLNQGESGKAANDHLFAGEQLDPTGLYFNRARYYSPSLGRFISRDRYAGENSDPLSLNRYNYTENNPVNWIDPSGHSSARTVPETQAIAITCAEAIVRGLNPECDTPTLPRIMDSLNLNPDDLWGKTKLTRSGKRADIAARDDWAWDFTFCETGTLGGIYEVEKKESAAFGLAQAVINVWFANNDAQTVNPTVYFGRRWQLGMGLMGFNVEKTLRSSEAAVWKMRVWYAMPGLILLEDWWEGNRKRKKPDYSFESPTEPDFKGKEPPWGWPGPWPWPPPDEEPPKPKPPKPPEKFVPIVPVNPFNW